MAGEVVMTGEEEITGRGASMAGSAVMTGEEEMTGSAKMAPWTG
jgi:hypothetical protein